MRSRTAPDLRGRCPNCLLREACCICAEIPRIPHRTPVIILRHVGELRRTSNSARIAAMALERCRVFDIGGHSPPPPPAMLTAPGTWLLFPPDADTPAGPLPEPSAVRTLVIPDGTWGQTRRLVRRVTGLSTLPRLSLPGPRRTTDRLRTSHADWAMATLECLAGALELLEGPMLAAQIDDLFAQFTQAVRRHRGAPRQAP